MKLSAFFSYYGAKHGIARRYPAPEHGLIIEPFAGSAAYACCYPSRRVELFEIDAMLCAVWRYLIGAKEMEILNLPDLREGQTVDDLRVPPEARWLIGLCLSPGSAQPKKSWSAWGLYHLRTRGVPGRSAAIVWSADKRRVIAGQLAHIRHWKIREKPWTAAPRTARATYFVDPPYESAGRHYRHSRVDYAALGAWCKECPGQVIACEAQGAAWLPFAPFADTHTQGRRGERRGAGRTREAVWTNAPRRSEVA